MFSTGPCSIDPTWLNPPHLIRSGPARAHLPPRGTQSLLHTAFAGAPTTVVSGHQSPLPRKAVTTLAG